MQMTFDQAMRPGLLQAFALKRSRGYVMRSEKRPGYGGANGGRNNRRQPKRPKAGVGYILLTLLILLVVWPVGIVMLWRKKVRMQAGTKLLISLLTLCISVFLIVFALTIHVDNPQYTEFQDKANDWLNRAAADVAVAGDAAYKKGVETWDVMTDFADNMSQPVLNTMADGIDKAVELTGALRDKLTPSTEPDETPEPVPSADVTPDEPEVTETTPASIEIRVPEDTPDPDSAKPLVSGLLTAAGELKPDETPEPTESAEPEADEGEAEVEEDGIEWTSVENGIEEETTPTPSPSPSPTPTPSPTPSPTPVPDIPVKAAGDATVYYNKDGKLYHMQSSCKSMKSAKAHTLSEAIADGKARCNTCGSPDAAILDEKNLVWADAGKRFHTTDECEKFEGQWTLISLQDAIDGGYEACADCQADIYAIVNAEPTPTPEPTATPTPEPTAVPETETVSPAATLKPAGDATVYHSSNGKFYHRFSVCKGMTGSNPYKLSEISSSYRRCKTCDAPDTALVGKTCLWMDEDGLCHTSDECAKFNGNYTMIERDDALSQSLTGCEDCGADEYLVANTTLSE